MRLLFATLLAIAAAGQGRAADMAISASLIVTTNGRELFQAWETNPAGGFSIAPVKVAKRGDFLSAVVLFMNCAADSDGNCNAELDITAFGPTGDVYGEFKGKELWVGKTAPARGHTQLGVDYMGLVIESHDPSGRYRVVATARDLVSGEAVVAEASFEVEPLPE